MSKATATKLHEYMKRHVTIDNKLTTVSVERIYWKALDEIAESKNQTPTRLLTQIMQAKPTDYKSRAGWLRLGLATHLMGALKRGAKPTPKE
ncbi:MAG: ribbon-helix-helix domain-containing protein [Betaproteobacteria bacterium]